MSVQEFEELVEFHHTGGPFRGFDCLGYIGNQQRNYIADTWVIEAAEALGWSTVELAEWMCSWYGRKALDAEPMDAASMHREMARADIAGLLAEATS